MANRKAYRLLLGSVLCSILSFSQLLYYSSAIASPKDIVLVKSSSFFIHFVIISLLKFLVPMVILVFLFYK